MLNYQQFKKNQLIIISENFLNNQITEEVFYEQFNSLNENIFYEAKNKITNWMGWLSKNINRLGNKIDSFFKAGFEKIKPLFKTNKTFALVSLAMLMTILSLELNAQNTNDTINSRTPDTAMVKAPDTTFTKEVMEVLGYIQNLEFKKDERQLYNEVNKLANELLENDGIITDGYVKTFKILLEKMKQLKEQEPDKYAEYLKMGIYATSRFGKPHYHKTAEDTKVGGETKSNEDLAKYDKYIKKMLEENNISGEYYVGIGKSMERTTAEKKSRMEAMGAMSVKKDGTTTEMGDHVRTASNSNMSGVKYVKKTINISGTFVTITIAYI